MWDIETWSTPRLDIAQSYSAPSMGPECIANSDAEEDEEEMRGIDDDLVSLVRPPLPSAGLCTGAATEGAWKDRQGSAAAWIGLTVEQAEVDSRLCGNESPDRAGEERGREEGLDRDRRPSTGLRDDSAVVWDVPSSHEEARAPKTSKKRKRTVERVTTMKMTRGVKRNLVQLGCLSDGEADVASYGNDLVGRKGADDKERLSSKTTQSGPRTAVADSMPDRKGVEASGTSRRRQLSSTGARKPTTGDAALAVEPSMLSDSQKCGYEYIHPASEDSHRADDDIARKRRPRGRPRYDSPDELSLMDDKTDASVEKDQRRSLDGKPEAGKAKPEQSKRRRGRPAKKRAVIETETRVDEGASSETGPMRNAKEAAGSEQSQGRASSGAQNREASRGEVKTEVVEVKSDSGQSSTATKARVPMSETACKQQGAAGSEEKMPAPKADAGAEAKTGDWGGKKASSQANVAARPLFRVGLSRRCSIAPLLKSVRK